MAEALTFSRHDRRSGMWRATPTITVLTMSFVSSMSPDLPG